MSLTADHMPTLRRLSELMNRASGQGSLQDLLDLIVEGAADVVGFRVAAVSLLQPDDHLEVVAVGGDPGAREALVGRRTPLRMVEAEFEVAERWGALRFVPADRLPSTAQPGWVADGWDRAADGDPDAWDPQDTLLAPFYGTAGDMLGLLSVDLPLSGRRPDQVQQGLLEVFANQAGIAINGAQQRFALAEQVRLAGAVQKVARISQKVLEPAAVVDAVVDHVRAGLSCSALWIRVTASEQDDAVDTVVTHSGHHSRTPPAGLVDLARRIAEQAWKDHVAGQIREGASHPAGLLSAEEVGQVLSHIAPSGTLLLAPIGSGSECLGHIVLTRPPHDRGWSDAEAAAALEMGRDLGRVIVNARLLALERRVAAQLRQADRAKTSLLSTVAHELKNPLASIVGHLELLAEDPDADTSWSLGVMGRNANRLQLLVDDLLTLSRVSDPDRPLLRAPVDLAELVEEAVDMVRPRAAQRGIRLSSTLRPGSAVVAGSRDELSRVVDNLVSNALKFSRDEGVVSLSSKRRGELVELTCADQGLGISEDDQRLLFTEFFRGTNPATLKVPGTGLGLSIVRQIVSRHRGTISVESALGVGTTFRVAMPAA